MIKRYNFGKLKMAKVKIDLQNKSIEIEGEEVFVAGIFEKSRNLFMNDQMSEAVDKSNISVRRQHKSGSLKESYTIIKNIDFNEPKPLKEFYLTKKPQSALEKNAVFIYYLDKIASIENINLNHIYTCYKEVSERMPQALKQSLADTSSKKGWIDTKSMSNIKITIKGESLVEHELSE